MGFAQSAQQFVAERSRCEAARGLSLDAFLLVPAQRIARYPLLLQVPCKIPISIFWLMFFVVLFASSECALLQAIVDKTPEDDPDHAATARAQQRMKEIVWQCNEHLRQVKRGKKIRKKKRGERGGGGKEINVCVLCGCKSV